MSFIGFTVPSDACRTEARVASGLFHATYRLARDGRFEEGERLWWEHEMEWFNRRTRRRITRRDRTKDSTR
jgi:hypothetical protein